MSGAVRTRFGERLARAAWSIALVFGPLASSAQEPTGRVVVRVVADGAPVEGAQVFSGGSGGLTDRAGRVELRLAGGPARVRVERIGYAAAEVEVTVAAGSDVEIEVSLEEEAIETEAIIVTSTRTDRRIEDEPLRVEVMPREEVEEKLLMTPGDIAMLLNETAGLRVQPTAPSVGGASVRIQGLRGRYTQILSDGLPLHGGQTGALGPLQIPPMDLGQVEVIKGVASALYGASALGGVVNLISRRPGEERDTELLLNQTTLGGTDAVAWSSATLTEAWGYTLLAGGHRQTRADVDDDGWADLPRFGRIVVRPRLFWSGDSGSSAMVTLGGTIEDREGGTMPGGRTPAGTEFREALDTRRVDAGLVGRRFTRDGWLVSVRASGALQRHQHRFGDLDERDQHATAFAETALAGTAGSHGWVIGLALQHDRFRSRSLEAFDYAFTVPGLFAQDEWAPAEWIALSASGRLDRHSRYGTFLNPRLSVLLRSSRGTTLRVSGGTGFYAPTPWTEETEAVGLWSLVPPTGLEAERAAGGSVDLGQTAGPFELNLSLFGSRISNAVQVRDAATALPRIALFNATEEVRTHGSEALVRFEREGIHVSATHVYLRSTEAHPEGAGRREVPLTPRHTFGLVGAWEQEDRGRVGVELYYTGAQALEGDPYRTRSEPYVVAGFLIERRFGPARVFLNAENVSDTRQTRHERLLRPAPNPLGRWTTDVWGPLEGRAFNAGVRWEL